MTFGSRLKVVTLTLAGGLVACASDAPKDDSEQSVIKLAAVLDRTGTAATPMWTEAAKLAESQINEALSRAGENVRFELLTADSRSMPNVAVEHVQRLVAEGAKSVIIDVSANYAALMKLQYDEDPAKHLDVPIVGIATTSPAMLNPNTVNPDPLTQAAYRDADHWSVRTTMSMGPQGLVLGQILLGRGDRGDVDGDGKVKLSIVLSNDPFGQGSTGAVKAALAELAPDALIETIAIDPMVSVNDIAYYGEIIEKAIDDKNEQSGETDGKPDMLISAALPDFAIAFTRSFAQSGSDLPLVNMGTLRSGTALETLGSDAEGKEGCSVVQVDIGPSGDTFRRDFRAWTSSTDLSNFVASSYDAVTALALAALIASKDLEDPAAVTPEQIRDAVRSTSTEGGESVGTGIDELTRAVRLISKGEAINYEGASGPVDFDANGNTKVRVVHFTIDDGKFKDDMTYDCVGSPTCEALQ